MDVQRQYRISAKKYHPDRPTGDEEKFKEVNNAYSRLEEHFKRPHDNPFMNFFDGFTDALHRRQRCIEIVMTIEELFTGKTIRIQNQTINLPAGMIPNTFIHIPELHLDCLIRLAKHNYFSVEHRTMNLIFKVNISLYEALVGYVGKIRHPSGRMLYISTPKNRVIKDGERMVCKGMGINFDSMESDFVVIFNVTLPTRIDVDKHRQVLQDVFECNVPIIIKSNSDLEVNLI